MLTENINARWLCVFVCDVGNNNTIRYAIAHRVDQADRPKEASSYIGQLLLFGAVCIHGFV